MKCELSEKLRELAINTISNYDSDWFNKAVDKIDKLRAETLSLHQAGCDESERATALEDAFAYEHVPLTKVGTIRVRDKAAQPLMPRRWNRISQDDAE